MPRTPGSARTGLDPVSAPVTVMRYGKPPHRGVNCPSPRHTGCIAEEAKQADERRKSEAEPKSRWCRHPELFLRTRLETPTAVPCSRFPAYCCTSTWRQEQAENCWRPFHQHNCNTSGVTCTGIRLFCFFVSAGSCACARASAAFRRRFIKPKSHSSSSTSMRGRVGTRTPSPL